jgi:hypothetical protein
MRTGGWSRRRERARQVGGGEGSGNAPEVAAVGRGRERSKKGEVWLV